MGFVLDQSPLRAPREKKKRIPNVLTRFAILRIFGVEVEKTMENHLVDPTEKAEKAASNENVISAFSKKN